MNFTDYLPFASSIVIGVFTVMVFRRYVTKTKKASHLLLWGIGLTLYFIGTFAEAWHTLFGWNALVFRLWYLSGAVLTAAWLGQGTVELLLRRRVKGVRVSHIILGVLIVASLYGAFKVFTAQLEPIAGNEMFGEAIVSPGVRILTPFFNSYGTLALVGGAIYSAYIFWRKRILPNRVVGNVLIAAGAMLPAMGGLFSRFGLGGYLYVGELLGAILMFAGFIRATTIPQEVQNPQVVPQPGTR